MLFTVLCPKCVEEQKGLRLNESRGSVVCSNCEMQFNVDVKELEIELDKNKIEADANKA